jgi:hypothetical protein
MISRQSGPAFAFLLPRNERGFCGHAVVCNPVLEILRSATALNPALL